MRQRNDTPFEVHVWADPVLVIGPGETVEFEHQLTGMTILEDEKPLEEKTIKSDTKSAKEVTQ